MSRKTSIADKNPTKVLANDLDDHKGTLKHIGGSQLDHWNVFDEADSLLLDRADAVRSSASAMTHAPRHMVRIDGRAQLVCFPGQLVGDLVLHERYRSHRVAHGQC
jgi:hypothetical protein